MLEAASFKAPGPGSWELEQTHLQRPLSRWMGPLFGKNMMRGFKEFTAHYGMLLSHLEIAIINGFGYAQPRPVGAPPGAKGPPPKLIFKILTKVHPEIRRRIKRSAAVYEAKTWRDDVKLWREDWQPKVVAENRALAAVDVTSLDDAALAAHLLAVQARVEDGFFRHHRMNGCTMLPVGDFLVHACEWTGKKPIEFLGLLRGASPASCGADAEVRALATAIRGDAAAAKLVASDADASEIIAALRKASGAVGETARAYLLEVEHRLVSGYDIGERLGAECPAVIVGAIRAAVADTGPSRAAEEARAAEDEAKRVRALVPEEHRAHFDELLAEARLVYGVRDERGYHNDAIACGLARRALLELGKRLVKAGKLEAAEHAVDLDCDEANALAAGKSGPSKEEVAKRFAYRTSHTIADAPKLIGPPPGPPPPADWLPPPAARMMRAVGMVLEHMFSVPPSEAEQAARTVKGLPASPGTYEGRARVIDGPDQFARIEKGDVLVTRMTSPSYNVLLPLLGGVVTDRGGLLSHAAIVAREYGLPAVVGTTDATKVIPDNARVRVDGASGVVTVL